jgi:thiol-disulfide isomerase/thioredoxin
MLAVVLTGCGGGAGGGSGDDDVAGLTFEPLDGGSEQALSSYEGTPLVVNFFAAWCAPCVTEMPAFEEVHQHFGDEVAFLGLSVNETVEEASAIVEQTGVTWDLGRDPRAEVLRALGGISMPTTVLIRADGTVADVHSGRLAADALTTMIEDQLLS